MALDRLALDAVDLEAAGVDRRDRTVGSRLVLEPKLVEFLAIEVRQPRGEVSRIGAQIGIDGPIFFRLESLDLEFASDLEPERDRLHAARRARARKLAPQDGGEREADEIIESAAREIGIDQLFVDLAWMLDGLE